MEFVMETEDFPDEPRAAVRRNPETDHGAAGPLTALTEEQRKQLIDNATCMINTKTWKVLVASSTTTMETLERWLAKYAPSTVTKEDGHESWISIVNNQLKPKTADKDVAGLQESWQRFLTSGTPVNHANIAQLACKHNVLSGKWLFFCSAGGKVDHLWSMVAKGILGNSWPCYTAKVSADTPSRENNRHVVCIYNEDFTNVDQVLQAEQAIRNMGLKCELRYKPDVYTYLGVYSNNPWNLKPIIKKSAFDLKTGKSIIESFVFDLKMIEKNLYHTG